MREQTESGQKSGSIKPGTRLNDIYEVTELLAVGGMSEVYKGHNIQTLDEVAIKVILPHLASDEQVISLFKQEASILNSLGHDAIVRYHVFSIDRLSNTAYLTMELVEGPSLYERIRDRPLSLAEAAKLISRITSGLKVAHERGVIHRDISCDNIILSGGNVEGAKLIDFGIARLGIGGDRTLLAGSFAGKYNYVSPEQLGLFGGDVHEPSDIYSLGLVFAAALRGTPLDMSGTHADVVRKRQSVPDLSTIHPAARSIIQRMLQPSPALRPKKDEIIDALRPMIPATKDNYSRRSQISASLRDGRGQTPSGQSGTKGTSGKWVVLACLLVAVGGAGWYGYVNQEKIKAYLSAQKTSKPATPSGKSEFKLDADPNSVKPKPEPQADQAKPIKEPEAPIGTATEKPPAATVEAKPDIKSAGNEKPVNTLPEAGQKPETLASGEQQKHDEPAQSSGGSQPQLAITEADWIKQFAGGPCFFAHGTIAAPRTINIEGFAQRVGPFVEMERAFISKFGYEPTINVRQIADAQCDALAFLAAAPVNTGKAAFVLKNEVLGPNDALAATLGGIEQKNVQVLLVRQDGTVDTINTTRRGDSTVINLNLAAPQKDISVPYMLIAIQSDEKLDLIGGKDTFKGLAAKLQQQSGKPAVTVKYFRQQG
ncbi:serine/threonine-protein kinase [Phyllobacterium sp. P30BS-XVII]|uniref:serine/threonine-protein kinase n=1 Tax=Phyllobacterium sp. P30BS-XVII TaxID=2587046 RepID=UPI000DD99E9C|nr:serine/threonine-protein kinase [Phyllobacterium sp. P30BS-XVII]MBA8903609.1 serine/threonine-protein kinase [Phyllobacterium sp. P30BS-XVII]